MCTKFYQNRRGFVEDMTKTFWCVLVHNVVTQTETTVAFTLCIYIYLMHLSLFIPCELLN